jgi:hypothetical protein
MKIELRSRKHKSGNTILYLECYEKGGKRQYESLNLYLIPEKTDNDRRVNEATLKKALKIKSERILGIGSKSEEKDVSTLLLSLQNGWMNTYSTFKREKDTRLHIRTICGAPST